MQIIMQIIINAKRLMYLYRRRVLVTNYYSWKSPRLLAILCEASGTWIKLWDFVENVFITTGKILPDVMEEFCAYLKSNSSFCSWIWICFSNKHKDLITKNYRCTAKKFENETHFAIKENVFNRYFILRFRKSNNYHNIKFLKFALDFLNLFSYVILRWQLF